MVTIRTPTNRSVWTFENEWIIGICGCCSNRRACCFAYWCFPCFMCRLNARSNEFPCTWCLLGGIISLRTKLRTGLRIRGSICSDICTMYFCPCCAVIQMYNELEYQGL